MMRVAKGGETRTVALSAPCKNRNAALMLLLLSSQCYTMAIMNVGTMFVCDTWCI